MRYRRNHQRRNTLSVLQHSGILGSRPPTTTATASITKAALVITTNNVNMVYGGAIPTFSVYYTGLVAGDTPEVLGGSLGFLMPTGLSKTSSVGSKYAITPSGLTASNYAITFRSGTLTVVQTVKLPGLPTSG